MNDESQDGLDQLLGDWASSREADDQHTSRLANQILSAAREQPMPASIHATSMSSADWGPQLMIGGSLLLLLLILAGGVLYYNLSTVPTGNPRQTGPIVVSPGGIPPATTAATDTPAAASLGATVLAAKRQLLAETNALFDNRLVWIADGQREVAFEFDEQVAPHRGEFMLVRVVVAQRVSPDSAWSTVWQTDVISRSEALVEVAPKQLDGSSLALWSYLLPDGNVAVDMDLMLNQQTGTQSASSTVLQAGQPTRVGCSTENGVEQCVFQTVMRLQPSHG